MIRKIDRMFGCKLWLCTILLCCGIHVGAQKQDSLQILKKFVELSNSFKRLPVQMSIDFKQESNFPDVDTSTVHGDLVVKNGNAYIRFGVMEQIVNDTLALVIMNDIKQMTLARNSNTIAGAIQSMVRMPVDETSFYKTAVAYKISSRQVDKILTDIIIESRQVLPGSNIPSATTTVRFNSQSNLLIRVWSVKRSLVKMPGVEQNQATIYKNITGDRVSISGKGDFIIREDRSVIMYKKISHADVDVPISLNDRIIKNIDTGFSPVKGFLDYHLSQIF